METLLEGTLAFWSLPPAPESLESTLGGEFQGLRGHLGTQQVRSGAGSPRSCLSVCEHLLSAYCVPAPSLAGYNRQAHRQLRLRQSTNLAGLPGRLPEGGGTELYTACANQKA